MLTQNATGVQLSGLLLWVLMKSRDSNTCAFTRLVVDKSLSDSAGRGFLDCNSEDGHASHEFPTARLLFLGSV